MAGTGFHSGELEVQDRTGVRGGAARLSGMLAPADLNDGVVHFLAERRLAFLAARDLDGQLWVSALEGPEGFLEAGPDWLHVHSTLRPGDPLEQLPGGQAVGLITIDFPTRRRFRLNGTLAVVGGDGLEITLDQGYGNCPKYIHPRSLGDAAPAADDTPHETTTALSPEQVELIRAADTFFLGTTHPERGNDVSHKGGPTGFVEVRGNELWWPDFVGNQMFNSFGNLAVDDAAALFFADYASGQTLHLSGRATVEFDAATETGRAARFVVEAVRWGVPLQQRED